MTYSQSCIEYVPVLSGSLLALGKKNNVTVGRLVVCWPCATQADPYKKRQDILMLDFWGDFPPLSFSNNISISRRASLVFHCADSKVLSHTPPFLTPCLSRELLLLHLCICSQPQPDGCPLSFVSAIISTAPTLMVTGDVTSGSRLAC